MTERAPYISVVVAARNDDHGGNMLGRMQAFLASWIEQARRYGLASEMVIVEWNPPAGRPRLVEAIEWPAERGECEVRIIEVRPRLHASLANAAAIPLHQMIAKNVGIRRARGEFVLATNLDIIFPAELMWFLAERRLERGVMYRVNRHDVARGLPEGADVDAILNYCRSHVLRVFARDGQFDWRDGTPRALEAEDIAAADAGIAFGEGWAAPDGCEGQQVRWIEREAAVFWERPGDAALGLDAEVGPSQGDEPLLAEVADGAGSVVASAVLEGRVRLRLRLPGGARTGSFRLRVDGRRIPLAPELRLLHLGVSAIRWEAAEERAGEWRLEVVEQRPGSDWPATFQAPAPEAARIRNAATLHINAAGDFTLLAREDWHRLRGYGEFPIWPLHIDGLFCYTAHHAGIREETLHEPLRVFHVEHSSGAGWTPEGEAALKARVEAARVPALSYDGDLARWVQLMRRLNAPAIFNLDGWGLASENLPERKL